MTNRLDAVAVGIPEEGRVIGGVIIAQAGRTVIAAAIGDAGIPERVDLGPPLRLETPVTAQRLVGFRALADRNIDALGMRRTRPFQYDLKAVYRSCKASSSLLYKSIMS